MGWVTARALVVSVRAIHAYEATDSQDIPQNSTSHRLSHLHPYTSLFLPTKPKRRPPLDLDLMARRTIREDCGCGL